MFVDFGLESGFDFERMPVLEEVAALNVVRSQSGRADWLGGQWRTVDEAWEEEMFWKRLVMMGKKYQLRSYAEQ